MEKARVRSERASKQLKCCARTEVLTPRLKEAPGGDDRPRAFEHQEAPLPPEVRIGGEDASADEVQDEVAARFGCDDARLGEGECGEDEQRPENLDEGTRRGLPLRRPSSGYGAPRPGGAERPPLPP
jgi:hypothetical protein